MCHYWDEFTHCTTGKDLENIAPFLQQHSQCATLILLNIPYREKGPFLCLFPLSPEEDGEEDRGAPAALLLLNSQIYLQLQTKALLL